MTENSTFPPPEPGTSPPTQARTTELVKAIPRLVRWPNLAIMLLSLVLVRGPLLLPGQPLALHYWPPNFCCW